MIKGLPHIPLHLSRKVSGYFGLAALFFVLSFATLDLVHRYFSARGLWIPSSLFSANVIGWLAILLVLYFLADGLRLYCVIRAMGFRIAFSYIVKLFFVNIFESSVTPLATGGGVVQVYFMRRKGMPVRKATAATSIRTILAALILFTLTPVIIWTEPNQFQMFFHHNLLGGDFFHVLRSHTRCGGCRRRRLRAPVRPTGAKPERRFADPVPAFFDRLCREGFKTVPSGGRSWKIKSRLIRYAFA